MSCPVCEGYSSQSCPCCGNEVSIIDCPDCKGTGRGDWKVFDIQQRMVIRSTEIAYIYAADSEDEAEEQGKRYCKESDICQTCKGLGEVQEKSIGRKNNRIEFNLGVAAAPTDTLSDVGHSFNTVFWLGRVADTTHTVR